MFANEAMRKIIIITPNKMMDSTAINVCIYFIYYIIESLFVVFFARSVITMKQDEMSKFRMTYAFFFAAVPTWYIS